MSVVWDWPVHTQDVTKAVLADEEIWLCSFKERRRDCGIFQQADCRDLAVCFSLIAADIVFYIRETYLFCQLQQTLLCLFRHPLIKRHWVRWKQSNETCSQCAFSQYVWIYPPEKKNLVWFFITSNSVISCACRFSLQSLCLSGWQLF